MSFLNYIERTRALPEKAKKRVLFFWVFGLAFLIFIIWAINFTITVSNQSANDALLQEKAKLMVESSTTPEMVTKTGAGSSWSGKIGNFVNENLSSVKDGFNILFKKPTKIF